MHRCLRCLGWGSLVCIIASLVPYALGLLLMAISHSLLIGGAPAPDATYLNAYIIIWSDGMFALGISLMGISVIILMIFGCIWAWRRGLAPEVTPLEAVVEGIALAPSAPPLEMVVTETVEGVEAA